MRDRPVIRRDDRGATLVIMAAFTIVAVIMTAAVVDLGGLRAEKKEVTLSTDAAALAAVQAIDYSHSLATGVRDCSLIRSTENGFVDDVARNYLTKNGQSAFRTCTIFFGAPGTNSAFLTVTADDSVDFKFGKAAGLDGGTVTGTSSARAGSASIDNVYPIGVCTDDQLSSFVNDQQTFPQYFGGNEQLAIDFGNSNCGAAGNHDQIDFIGNPPPGSCGSAGQFCYDLNNGGFGGTVPPTIGSNPGSDWNPASVSDPVRDLRDRQVHIWLPSVGPVVDDGGGNPAYYPVEYFVEVVITYFEHNDGMEFDVYQVVDYSYYEDNGLPVTTVNQQVRPHICATSDDTSGCTTNPPLSPPPSPPPPPPPCVVNSVTTNPTSIVDVDTAGDLKADLTVTATVADAVDCDLVTLEAVSSTASSVQPSSATQSGNTFTWVYTTGTFFSAVNNTVFSMAVSEDGDLRHTATSVTVRAPACVVTAVNPASQPVAVVTDKGKTTTAVAVSWTVTISNHELCGVIAGEVYRNNGDRPALTGPGAAAASMTFSLPAGTQVNKSSVYSVRIYNGGVVAHSTATLTTGA